MENSIRVKPDLLSYSGVISCISKSKKTIDAERAEAILHRMEKIFEIGNDSLRPDTGERLCLRS